MKLVQVVDLTKTKEEEESSQKVAATGGSSSAEKALAAASAVRSKRDLRSLKLGRPSPLRGEVKKGIQVPNEVII